MNFNRILFLSILVGLFFTGTAFSQMMPPSTPSQYYYPNIKVILNSNNEVDNILSNTTTRMRKGTTTYQAAISDLQYCYRQTVNNESKLNTLIPGPYEMLHGYARDMFYYQKQRISELIDATKYEQQYGYESAKFKWNTEINTFYKYDAAKKKAWNLFRTY
jgi:hypothetical protein